MDSFVYDQVSGQLREHIKDNDIIQTIWNSIRKPQLVRSTVLQKPETVVNNRRETSLVATMENGNILLRNPSLNRLVKVHSMAMSSKEIYAVYREELFVLDLNWNVTRVMNLRTILDFKEGYEEINMFFVTSWQGTMVIAMTDAWMDNGYQNHFGITFRSIDSISFQKYVSFPSSFDREPKVIFFSHYICAFNHREVTIRDILNPEYERIIELPNYDYSTGVTGFVIHNDRIFLTYNSYIYVYSATHMEPPSKNKNSKQVPIFINYWNITCCNNIIMAPYGDHIIVCSHNQTKAYVLTTDGKPLYDFNTCITPSLITTLNDSILIEGPNPEDTLFSSKLVLFQ
jgi:hypothetical protein